MDMNRSLISQVVDNGDGTVLVVGADLHGNQAAVHCGRDQLANGAVYAMLDIALDKVRQTREHLAATEAGDPQEE